MNRIIFKDNTTLLDKSTDFNSYNFSGFNFTIVPADDALYIGSEFPFNDLYFKLTQVNSAATASTVTVSTWSNNAWKAVAEKFDETSISGVAFKQSGHISFEPDRNYLWSRESTNDSGEVIADLSTLNIYDRYWTKFNFTGEFPEIGFGWIGQKFGDDNDLAGEYPDLCRADVMSAWQTGKTSWEEQFIVASQILINDLKNKRIIDDGVQLLDRHELKRIVVSKVAEIIFNGMGTSYADNAKRSRDDYIKRSSEWTPRKVDINRTGRMDQGESYQFGRLLR